MRSCETDQALRIGERIIPLRIRRHARARRIVLRYHPLDGAAILTLPMRTSMARGLAFAQRQSNWLAAQIEKGGERIPFAPGVSIPFLGESYPIRHNPQQRGVVRCEEGALQVAGRAEHLPRRLRDWLKQQLKSELEARAMPLAARLDRRVVRISLRDTKSCWASCNAKGHLSFSWRLVFAPPAVLDYIVAHEVAHLRVMGHNRKFWQTVAELHPGFEQGRAWLKRHGHELYRYG